MKHYLFLLLLVLPGLSLAQPSDRFATFAARKQSVALRTGITLQYIDRGNRDGATVVLLHGYTDSGRSFQYVIDALADQDPTLRIIAPDLRGHGGSSLPTDPHCRETPEDCFRLADLAADVVALLDTLGIARAHIVGHSNGSVLAQELALHHAGRVNSLVLIGTFVDGTRSAAIQQFLIRDLLENTWRPLLELDPGFRWPADAWSLTPNDLGPAATDFLRDVWVADPTVDPALLRAILAETARVPLGVWIGAIRAVGMADTRDALRALKKPTLVLWATQDNLFPEDPDQLAVRAAFRQAARHTGVRVVFKTYGKTPLPESGAQNGDLGHNFHWAAAGAVAADILSFIRHGVPKNGIPYANPSNLQELRVDDEE